ncbi:hypothetical protein ACIBG4_40555 [Nonomuraea sp. NPDC050383]|uniref:hypothetical protein n=1 Tax=Nonomuraea sp. NPDC050383 TaxID=3364362 RepID=UPI00379C1AAC
MTTLLQDPLFDDEPATPKPTPKPAHTYAHPRAPRRNPDFRAEFCTPICITCGNPEHPDGRQHCWPTCSTLCQHVAQPHRTDVCLTTTRAAAQIVTSPYSGHTIAIVRECPHCGRAHAHAPTPGTHHRISGCRRPYILHIPEVTS